MRFHYGDRMHEELIQLLATAGRITCTEITSARQATLRASLDQACSVPAELGWERKVAAHAAFFNASLTLPTTRRRMLACLRAGDADQAACEMEKHLRRLMWVDHGVSP